MNSGDLVGLSNQKGSNPPKPPAPFAVDPGRGQRDGGTGRGGWVADKRLLADFATPFRSLVNSLIKDADGKGGGDHAGRYTAAQWFLASCLAGSSPPPVGGALDLKQNLE